ncbi:MAG: DMT family transporter [bacterium]
MTGYIFLFITIILFSSMETAGRLIHTSIGPLTMTFMRFFIGFLVLLPFVLFSRKERMILRSIKGRALFDLFSLGFLNVFLSMMLLQIAVHIGCASIPAILISSNPLFVYLITAFSLKSISKRHVIKILSGMIGIAGIAIFTSSGSFDNSFSASLLSLLAAFLFALYTLKAHDKVAEFSNLTVTTLSFVFGSLCYLPFIFIFEDFSSLYMLNIKEAGVMLYMGIFVTGIGYILFFEGLKRIKVHIGSMVFFLKPFFAILFSFLFLKERILPIQMFFAAFMLYSIMPEIRKKSADNT